LSAEFQRRASGWIFGRKVNEPLRRAPKADPKLHQAGEWQRFERFD
jgi:hypothetical protein